VSDRDHDDLHEMAALYALGALEPIERDRFDAHVRTCDACQAGVRAYSTVALRLSQSVSQIDPPATLRRRILDAAMSGTRASANMNVPRASSWGALSGWLAAAAMLIAVLSLGWYAMALRSRVEEVAASVRAMSNRVGRIESEVSSSIRTIDVAQVRMAVLTAPDVRQVTLAGQPAAPQAAGRAFWSRSRGLVFAAASLPPLPQGRTYQLWYLTAAAPISAGLVVPDAAGRAAAVFEPAAGAEPSGFALSIEPEGGVPAPTGALYLAGMRHDTP
jgi:anti-sigma-K factor RskA